MRAAVALALATTLFLVPRASRADDAVHAATSWIAAVSDADFDQLVARTHFPFRSRGLTAASRVCRAIKASTDTAGFRVYAGCIFANEPFRSSLPAKSSVLLQDWKPMTAASIPRAARSLLGAGDASRSFVGGSLTGDGIGYAVVLAITPEGTVAAVFADAMLVE